APAPAPAAPPPPAAVPAASGMEGPPSALAALPADPAEVAGARELAPTHLDRRETWAWTYGSAGPVAAREALL
ncbi:MAG TPA: hypothetical protein VHF22_07430, partial [Planctomycetota bacterium]|nr:hypothetical protein [Planctomycetota bacterium]